MKSVAELVAGIAGWIGSRLGMQAGAITTYVAVSVTLWGTFYGVIASALATISLSAPEEIALGVGLMPSNTPTCLSVMVWAMVARRVYVWQKQIARDAYVASFVR